MSYILDALKKADAQRERDPARGIHAQPASPASGERRHRTTVIAPGFGAPVRRALAVLASVAWYLYQDKEAVAVRTVPAVAIAPTPGPVAIPAVVPVTPPPAPVATVVLPPPPAVMPAREPARDPRNTSQPVMRGRPQPAATVAQATVPYGAPPAVAPPPAAAPQRGSGDSARRCPRSRPSAGNSSIGSARRRPWRRWRRCL